MATEPVRNGGAQFTWVNVVLSLSFGTALFVALFSAQWAIFSQRTTAIDGQIRMLSDLYEKRHDQLIDAIVKINVELSTRKDRFRDEFWTREEEKLQQKSRDDQWSSERDKDNTFVHIDQFNAYTKLRDNQYNIQQEINKQAQDAYVNTKAFEAGQSQRDKVIDQILRRLDGLEIQKK